MPANILDVRELSKTIRAEIKDKVALLNKKPRIDFVYFDDDKSTELYFTHAKKMAENPAKDPEEFNEKWVKQSKGAYQWYAPFEKPYNRRLSCLQYIAECQGKKVIDHKDNNTCKHTFGIQPF